MRVVVREWVQERDLRGRLPSRDVPDFELLGVGLVVVRQDGEGV